VGGRYVAIRDSGSLKNVGFELRGYVVFRGAFIREFRNELPMGFAFPERQFWVQVTSPPST
jgi:hypothetical protein